QGKSGGTRRLGRGIISFAAELEIGPSPERSGKFQRRGRPLPARLNRCFARRIPAPPDGPQALQRGRRGRYARIHAVVARQQKTRLPARLPYRVRRRNGYAELRFRLGYRKPER